MEHDNDTDHHVGDGEDECCDNGSWDRKFMAKIKAISEVIVKAHFRFKVVTKRPLGCD